VIEVRKLLLKHDHLLVDLDQVENFDKILKLIK